MGERNYIVYTPTPLGTGLIIVETALFMAAMLGIVAYPTTAPGVA